MAINELNESVKKFSQRMKSGWQVLFLITAVIYGPSLYHSLKVKPSVRPGMAEYIQNLDLLSFFIAIALALLILNLKRRYFTKKFSRKVTEASLTETPEISDQELLNKIFSVLQKKIGLVWILGFLIVLDGVILYWATFLARSMHIYFIVGAFSLALNYPRRELFSEIPWYIREARKDFNGQNSSLGDFPPL